MCGPERFAAIVASIRPGDEPGAYINGVATRRGFHAVVLAGSGPKGRIYRVRVGPYGSEEEASHAVTKLRQEKIREPWIVPDGK